jgi:hypothetical protein
MSLSTSRAAFLRAGTLLLLVFTALIAAGPARAAVPITSLYAGPITAESFCTPDGTGAVASTQAGSRSDFCVAFALNSPPPAGDDLERMTVDTPLGFAGDPTGRPQCTAVQFAYESSDDSTCPADSQVGDAFADIIVATSDTTTLPITELPGRAYNLVPSSDEVALIGLVLDPPTQPHVKILIHVTLRPAPNVGLRATINDLPRTVCLRLSGQLTCGLPLELDSFALRFWGSTADHPEMPAPFALLGADCSRDQVTRVDGISSSGAATSGESRYRLTDCDTLPFSPQISVDTADNRPDVPSAATVSAKFTAEVGGRMASPPAQAVVTLPAGLALGAQIASGPAGLPLCAAADFALTSSAPAVCPAGSSIGDVKIATPLLDAPLTGRAYVGAQPAVGQLPDLYLEAALGTGPLSPRVKLVGTLAVGEDGRIVATLDDLPQVPVSSFVLTFRGGPQAPLVTPEVCGSQPISLLAAPRSGRRAQTVGNFLVIGEDCTGAGGFAPAVGFSTSDPRAGGSGVFTTSLSRPDRTQRLQRLSVDLPSGQVATLKGVPECPTASAAAGTCDASTRVGGVTALSGVGSAPYRVTGSAYLTARPEGAVAGLAIHAAVKIGELDLGSLDVLARIEIRDDLGLRIVADVPLTFRGLPLNLQQLDVALDRPGFARNPTSCGPLTGSATFAGSRGGAATATGGYQVGSCNALAFAPTFEAAVTGDTQTNGRPTTTLRITNPDGSAALRDTSVVLPTGLAVDLDQIPRACAQDTFRAGGCPDTARIGTVSGALAIADEALGGYVYLLQPPSKGKLPGIGLAFVGRFAGRLIGTNGVDKTGRIVARFAAIPDLPLTDLRIQIDGGKGGPLIAAAPLCASTVAVNAELQGQNGASATRESRTVCGAPLGTRIPQVSGRISRLRGGSPVLALKTSGSDRPITRVDLTLPAGWTVPRQPRKSAKYAKVSKLSGSGAASLARRSSRRLRITLPKAGSSSFYVLTRSRSIRVKKAADRKTKKAVTVFVHLNYATGPDLVVPVALTPH